MGYKLWIDDTRVPPEGNEWIWCKTTEGAIQDILFFERTVKEKVSENPDPISYDTYHLELIDIDHDAGEYAEHGGDYIKVLEWLEETGRRYPIHIHSMNPVGVENMRRIIRRNGWEEIR